MKYLFTLSSALFLSLAACTSTQKIASDTPKPALFVSWDKKMLDLGKVPKGEKRTFFYEFTNTSKEDAQIEIVDACECTKVEFPRGPIQPGGKGKLEVIFDSTEKDSSETIGINVVFKNIGPDGYPRLELVEYRFDLIKN
jgi:peptidoglycan-associated lipoprotein